MRPAMRAGALVLVGTMLAAASCTGGSGSQEGGSTDGDASARPSASPRPSVTPSPTAPAEASASPSPTGSPGQTWSRSLGFSAEAIATDGAGNVYVTGFAPFGPAQDWGRSVAMVLEKSDPDGTPLWTKRWRSTSKRFPDAAGWDVAVSPDGGTVYVSGAIMLPPWEVQRGRLWAFSSDGRRRWVRGISRNVMTALVAGAAGLVAGGGGSVRAWGPDGSPTWARSFEEPEGEHCDVVEDVAIGDRGEIYVVGFLDTTPTCAQEEGGAFEDADIVIQQRSSSGDVVWSEVLSDPGVDNDRASAVAVSDGSVFVAGQRDGRAWIARLTPDGELAWTRRWGPRGMVVRTVDLSASPWGPLYLLAERGPLIVHRYAQDGDLEWDRRLRLGMKASGVATAAEGALYVAASDFAESGELLRIVP